MSWYYPVQKAFGGLGVAETARLTGVRGLDVFKIAGASISGWYPSYKAPPGGFARQPYTTQLEFFLGLYLEYHPWVATYQRGDLSAAFALSHRLAAPLGTPYGIDYEFEGGAHTYLPDYAGTLADGGLLVAEAGLATEKAKDQARAKAHAATRWAHAQGGAYWLGTEDLLAGQRHWNWLFLHAHRREFPSFSEIAEVLRPALDSGEPLSVTDAVERWGSRWSEAEVEAALWKIAGDGQRQVGSWSIWSRQC